MSVALEAISEPGRNPWVLAALVFCEEGTLGRSSFGMAAMARHNSNLP